LVGSDGRYVRRRCDESVAQRCRACPLRERLQSVITGVSLTPGVLTVKTASTLEPSLDVAAVAERGAGVQLTFEGLRLARSNIREEPWEEDEAIERYHLDLLAANVLFSRGFYHLTDTGVADETIAIIQRFARNQTHEQEARPEQVDAPLEVDIIQLAVNAGADMALGTVPPAVSSYGESLARQLQQEPFAEPETALTGVEERLTTLVGPPEMAESEEHD